MPNLLRAFFLVFVILLSLLFAESALQAAIFGLGALLFSLGLIAVEKIAKEDSLQRFNLVFLGLLLGYLLASLVKSILFSFLSLPPEFASYTSLLIHLGALYLAVGYTFRSADKLYLSIPFVQLREISSKRKDLLVGESALLDPRMIDLAVSGLLDHQIVIPRFVTRALQKQSESDDEAEQSRAKRGLDLLRKLDQMESLGLRYSDRDFPELTSLIDKLVQLAKVTEANILAADMSRIEQSSIEATKGLKVVSIHALSNALKPLTQSGETLEIKVQRHGKEEGQGVGYLEDGTMVVVNGGADYIGETIQTHVLSVKHTSSGRMIFCNAAEGKPRKVTTKSYFAMDRS